MNARQTQQERQQATQARTGAIAAADSADTQRRSLFWPCVLASGGFIFLCGLGVWQLQRLQWKENIIARMESRIAAPAVALAPQSAWDALAMSDSEYRKFRVTGTFDHSKETYIFRSHGAGQLGPVFHVLTPLSLADGSIVLVNRGFVPAALRDPASRAAGQIAGPVTVTGFLRQPEARNVFTPADTPGKRIWYSRDPNAVAAHLGLQSTAPFVIEADASANPGGWPRGGITSVKIPNNHLSYAWTWFGLAATLLAVFAAFAWPRRRA